MLKPSCAIHIPSILNSGNKRIGSKSARRETGQKSSDSDHWPVNRWISGNNTLADWRLIIWYFSRKLCTKEIQALSRTCIYVCWFSKTFQGLEFLFFFLDSQTFKGFKGLVGTLCGALNAQYFHEFTMEVILISEYKCKCKQYINRSTTLFLESPNSWRQPRKEEQRDAEISKRAKLLQKRHKIWKLHPHNKARQLT